MNTPIKDIAIIGAGIAGLAAARDLRSSGHHVVIYEETRAAGGRIASRHHESLVFDHGAQNIKSFGSSLEEALRRLLPPEEIIEIMAPVNLHDGRAIFPGDQTSNAERKWTCRGGMAQLTRALAQGHEIRLAKPVQFLVKDGKSIVLVGKDGKELGRAEAVILTIPVPQAVELLQKSALEEDLSARLEALQNVVYSRNLSVLLHYETELEADWYALLAQDRGHPLLWLARENAKGPSFVPDGMGTALVAQFGPVWSAEHFKDDDERIVNRCGQWMAALLGDDFREAEWSYVKRWRHAQPTATAEFGAVNPPGSRLVIAGDGVSRGRIPDAHESGLRAARLLMDA